MEQVSKLELVQKGFKGLKLHPKLKMSIILEEPFQFTLKT